MSYRTYILEKELSEMKVKLKEVTEALAEVAFSLSDDNLDDGSEYYEVWNTIKLLPDDVQKTYEELYARYCARSMEWFNAREDDEHEQRMQEEYEESDRVYDDASGKWYSPLPPEDRDYPDEKTGED